MKNINVSNANKQPNQYTDYSVDENGHSWISQSETAKKCGVHFSTISKFINRHKSQGLNLNEFNQLSPKTLVFVTGYYANKGNKTAINFLHKLAEAGAEVYIRGMVGRQSLEHEQLKISNTKIEELQNDIEKQQKIIKEQQITLKKQEKHNLITYQNGNQCLRKWKNGFQDKYGIYINERELWMFLQSKGIVNYIRKTTYIKRLNDIYFGDQVQDSIVFNDNIEYIIEDFLNENNMI